MRNPSRRLTLTLIALTPCLAARPAGAGWLSAEQESFTGDDVKAVAKQGGNFKKNWQHFQELVAQTRENERRIEALRKQAAPAGRRQASEPGASLEELTADAGPRFNMGTPPVGAAAPLLAAPRADLNREETDLWRNIQAYVNAKVRTPEIRGWIAEYMWTASHYTGANEVLRDHADNIFAARASTPTASARPGTAPGDPAQPEEGAPAERQDAQKVSEFAETLAWRGMACAAGVPAIIPDVQRCGRAP